MPYPASQGCHWVATLSTMGPHLQEGREQWGRGQERTSRAGDRVQQKCICPTLSLLLHPKSVLPGVTQAWLSDAVRQEQAAGHLRCEVGGNVVPSCLSRIFRFFALDIGACRHTTSQFRELTCREIEHFISAGFISEGQLRPLAAQACHGLNCQGALPTGGPHSQLFARSSSQLWGGELPSCATPRENPLLSFVNLSSAILSW